MMGSPEKEYGHCESENYHQVTIDHGFWLGKYPVTQEQYKVITGKIPFGECGSRCVLTMITRDEAKDFCNRLNAVFKNVLPNGYQFDLPSEAQWEYACRTGTTTAFSNGKDMSEEDDPENYLGDIAWCPEIDDFDDFCGLLTYIPRPVGQYAPNPWGFYDMHGNVEEWCLDWWSQQNTSGVEVFEPGKIYVDPEGPQTNLTGNKSCRGGSYASNTANVRCAARSLRNPPDNKLGSLGFRVYSPVVITLPVGE
jgi:formylglycine-generating enzyme required for sulfatase activity